MATGIKLSSSTLVRILFVMLRLRPTSIAILEDDARTHLQHILYGYTLPAVGCGSTDPLGDQSLGPVSYPSIPNSTAAFHDSKGASLVDDSNQGILASTSATAALSSPREFCGSIQSNSLSLPSPSFHNVPVQSNASVSSPSVVSSSPFREDVSLISNEANSLECDSQEITSKLLLTASSRLSTGIGTDDIQNVGAKRINSGSGVPGLMDADGYSVEKLSPNTRKAVKFFEPIKANNLFSRRTPTTSVRKSSLLRFSESLDLVTTPSCSPEPKVSGPDTEELSFASINDQSLFDLSYRDVDSPVYKMTTEASNRNEHIHVDSPNGRALSDESAVSRCKFVSL